MRMPNVTTGAAGRLWGFWASLELPGELTSILLIPGSSFSRGQGTTVDMAQNEKDSVAETQTYGLGWARCHLPFLIPPPTSAISGLWLGLQALRPHTLGSGVCCVLAVPRTGA